MNSYYTQQDTRKQGTRKRAKPLKKTSVKRKKKVNVKKYQNRQKKSFFVWSIQNIIAFLVSFAFIVSLILLFSFYIGGYTNRAIYNLNSFSVLVANITGLKYERLVAYGRNNVSVSDLKNVVNYPLGASIIIMDINKITDNIKKLPWVKSVAVTRLLPNTLALAIKERKAVAVFSNAEDTYLIDSEGVLLEKVIDDDYTNLPYYYGEKLAQYFPEIYKEIGSSFYIKNSIYSIKFLGYTNWQINLQSSNKRIVIVKMPYTGFKQAIIYLDKLIKDGVLDKKVKYLDLRHVKKISIY